ncbi:MarR family winged helix-turn-helix transcriptional regulator [Ectobacillus panaciterrae]|uniref:MarR family winged helix-turn-helix transcriptional regulator n=1 Tax=Ectobacillus panaciterrae TaxID=363872 RepID=UPI000407E798|nr:MarR family transcriptional regulator [Ectobacillus panaciterrae]
MLHNHSLFHSVHQLSRNLTKNVNEALQPFGIYSAQWSVLYTLKVKGTLTQTELCEYLSVEAPPMTRTIQRLVKQGYVKQVPGGDKRTKHIQLTEQALTEYPKWEHAILEVNASLLTHFPESSQEELYALVSEWIHQLQLSGGK